MSCLGWAFSADTVSQPIQVQGQDELDEDVLSTRDHTTAPSKLGLWDLRHQSTPQSETPMSLNAHESTTVLGQRNTNELGIHQSDESMK
jgi:hypothetical protein